jgi:hypothetical protein
VSVFYLWVHADPGLRLEPVHHRDASIESYNPELDITNLTHDYEYVTQSCSLLKRQNFGLSYQLWFCEQRRTNSYTLR